jgi:predicted AAA+ superfamily ATPase
LTKSRSLRKKAPALTQKVVPLFVSLHKKSFHFLYIDTESRSNHTQSVFYWSAEGGKAEVDFILQYTGKVIPIEVKAEENLQAKSLKSYIRKYAPETAIRTSMSDFRKEEQLTNIPLYAIGQDRIF